MNNLNIKLSAIGFRYYFTKARFAGRFGYAKIKPELTA